MHNLHTTSDREECARNRLASDWDADGTTSVYLPRDVAERLLVERGWTNDDRYGYGWVSPNGYTVWSTDEALQLALVAENS